MRKHDLTLHDIRWHDVTQRRVAGSAGHNITEHNMERDGSWTCAASGPSAVSALCIEASVWYLSLRAEAAAEEQPE
jgi:hypothetical protein